MRNDLIKNIIRRRKELASKKQVLKNFEDGLTLTEKKVLEIEYLISIFPQKKFRDLLKEIAKRSLDL